MRFGVRGGHDAPDVAVVAIDTKSLTEIRQFPFSRTHHARVIRQLTKAGAGAIVYDVQFTEPSADPGADSALIDAIDARAADRARHERGRRRTVRRTCSAATTSSSDVGARAASVNLPNDPGGVIRRLAYDESGLKSLPVVGAEVLRGRPVVGSRRTSSPTARRGSTSPARRGASRRCRSATSSSGASTPRDVRGKAVVVGATAPSLKDVFPVATSSDDLMAGPEIQAGGDPDRARRPEAAQRARLARRAADRRARAARCA